MVLISGLCSGSTTDFDSVSVGSNPAPEATCRVSTMVVRMSCKHLIWVQFLYTAPLAHNHYHVWLCLLLFLFFLIFWCSLIGRTTVSKTENSGSNPDARARRFLAKRTYHLIIGSACPTPTLFTAVVQW